MSLHFSHSSLAFFRILSFAHSDLFLLELLSDNSLHRLVSTSSSDPFAPNYALIGYESSNLLDNLSVFLC